jgi:hypothetical protein
MKVPQVIAERIVGRGKLLTLPLVGVTTFAGVWAFKGWGALAVVVAALLGATAELWRDSLEKEQKLTELEEQISGLEEKQGQLTEGEEALRRDVGERRARTRELEAAVRELDTENRQLRSQVEAPQLSLPHFVYALGAQLQIVELVQKHRELGQALGASEWPVVAIRAEDGNVTATAHVNDGSGRLSGEPVVLIDRSGDLIIGESLATPNGRRQVDAVFAQGALTSRFRHADGGSPDGYVLRLAGLAATTRFVALTDEELSTVATELAEVSSQLGRLLMASDNPSSKGKSE